SELAERNIGLPMIAARPVEDLERCGALSIVSNEGFDPETRAIGGREIEPSVDVAAGRRGANNIEGHRRTAAPSGLETGGIEKSISDATRNRLRQKLAGTGAQSSSQALYRGVARLQIGMRVGVSDQEFVAYKGFAKGRVNRHLR